MAFRFGDFVLDRDTRQLLFRQEEVHLSPKAFDLLRILLVNRPRVVSKADLQQQLWPSTFVEESNIAGLVAEVRGALRDSASDPKFVRTVYRFGYRFVGEVAETAGATSAPPSRVRLWLVVEDRELPLMEGANTMGRSGDATLPLDFRGVSRAHARILVSGRDATVEDLGSKNGTYVNGKRITTPHRLTDRDEVRLGAVVMTFRIALSEGPTETVTIQDK